ncbi:ankyrin repeat protein [Nannizzia gypsea CBS 118893]|uniref:Ankyrin repeat protein n=1 Tax=Arthroderma gypseum (strain ATCC MYA-4604 / CBS 118893) TaxID=535722 RepID=E4V3J0_ARTGP|nr:ankyrin repeat protein [Nannizzia gypsea CBS 118893]EFR04564.1 ankyrin repeat protein [Nannizzia gypsea CBS 118893]
MDPLNTISATLALVGTVQAAYQTLDKISNLPNAFNEIKARLPLVDPLLNDAMDALNDTTLSEEETKAILAVITPCNEAAVKMNCIFREVRSKCEKDQNARSWDIVSPLYHKALRGKGAHRAEKLMRTIFQGLEEMAQQRVFKTAMQKDVKALEEAIEGLSKVEPSLPDADFEAGGTNVTQNNATGAFGQLNAPRGGHNVYISGQYAAHTLNIGKGPEISR